MGSQFSLPLGVVSNGDVNKDVVLTPMTAKTRRILTTRKNQRNPAEGMSELICSCCESIGGQAPTIHLISSLCTGDRDFILLKLREISIGEEVEAQMTCPRCSEEISFTFNLSDLEIRDAKLDEDFVIEDGIPIVTLTDDDKNLVVKMRLPTGIDQEVISKQVNVDPVGASYALYARVLQSWTKDGQDAVGINSVSFVDNLPLSDIDWLEREVRKALPGPDWTVTLTCDLCSKSAPLDLSDSDFLFKTQR